jgi:uncharacterized protein (TIGR00106 family)
MFKQINLAVQIIPFSKEKKIYALVDKAIEVIQKSGIKYKVCPFETVLEGNYDDIMDIVKKAQEACFRAGADEVIVNIKIQNRKDSAVTINEKMKKYKD